MESRIQRTLGTWGVYVLMMFVFLIVVWMQVLFAQTAIAAPEPMSQRPPINLDIELGTVDGALQFSPPEFSFVAGKRYRLHLKNESPTKHYFTAKDFADAIWSQKVDAGQVEIKGAIHELELRPNTQADWVFIPLRAGSYSLRCTVPGHTEAGMVGTLKISG